MVKQPNWLTFILSIVWLVALVVMLFMDVPKLVATYCVARGVTFLLEQFARADEAKAVLVQVKAAAPAGIKEGPP